MATFSYIAEIVKRMAKGKSNKELSKSGEIW